MPSESEICLGGKFEASRTRSRFCPNSEETTPAFPYLQYLYVKLLLRKRKGKEKGLKMT